MTFGEFRARRAARALSRALLAMAWIVSLAATPSPPVAAPDLTTQPGPQPKTAPRRIISLVPSATEMLFAIGAGAQVVAVGSFDRYPPDVVALPRVGGLLDPDVERILALRPDLVIVYGTQTDLTTQLARAGIPIFPYRHGGLADVLETMCRLGERVGRAAEAARARTTLADRLAAVRARVAGRPRPRTLVLFGRDPFALRNMVGSGGVGFIHDLLETAGGANVFGDVPRESVQVTTESILARAPDVIVELRAEAPARSAADDARDRRSWDVLSSVPAVRMHRVHVLTGAPFVVPGPRLGEAAEAFARLLHPEAFEAGSRR